MTPDEFYLRYLDPHPPMPNRAQRRRPAWAARASVSVAVELSNTRPADDETASVGRVVGRIAGGRILPLE